MGSFRDGKDHEDLSVGTALAMESEDLSFELGRSLARLAVWNGGVIFEALQRVAGTAPVSFQSRQNRKARIRWHCNRHLWYAVHLWSDCSRKVCGWAQAYYQAQREKGHSHACALRCLGQRWLKILWKMWQSRRPYDETLHGRNQQRHGPWV